jgi:hypothetical protein
MTPDPLEPLRKMIEKWRKSGDSMWSSPGGARVIRECADDLADDLAAALPALEEAMAIGPCGKHPKMFWVGAVTATAQGLDCANLEGCCTLCAERDAARISIIATCAAMLSGDTNRPEYQEFIRARLRHDEQVRDVARGEAMAAERARIEAAVKLAEKWVGNCDADNHGYGCGCDVADELLRALGRKVEP